MVHSTFFRIPVADLMAVLLHIFHAYSQIISKGKLFQTGLRKISGKGKRILEKIQQSTIKNGLLFYKNNAMKPVRKKFETDT